LPKPLEGVIISAVKRLSGVGRYTVISTGINLLTLCTRRAASTYLLTKSPEVDKASFFIL